MRRSEDSFRSVLSSHRVGPEDSTLVLSLNRIRLSVEPF